MSEQLTVREAERKAFRATYNDGMWDIFLGCFLSIFVVAPYLSPALGDFWSAIVFVPYWALIYLAISLIRKRVVAPRIGAATPHRERRRRLKRLSVVLLILNTVALVLGIAAAVGFRSDSGALYSTFFGLMLLIALSLAAHYLDYTRLYLYGLLVGVSPMVGEWLWSHGYAMHHGLPLTFGASIAIMIAVGSFVFARLLHDNPLPAQ